MGLLRTTQGWELVEGDESIQVQRVELSAPIPHTQSCDWPSFLGSMFYCIIDLKVEIDLVEGAEGSIQALKSWAGHFLQPIADK